MEKGLLLRIMPNGAYAMILGNMKIGNDSIIGAGSVVQHNVEPFGTYVTSTEVKKIIN